MTSSVEAITSLIAAARGERPVSFENPEAEIAMNVALSLAVELIAANDRIARLERTVATLTDAVVEEDPTERQQEAEALLLRVLRILIDPRRQAQA